MGKARTSRVSGLAAATLVALIAPGCHRQAEEVAAPIVTVDVAPVLLSDIQRTITAEAILYPVHQAAIAPKVSAPIKKVYVQRGGRVRAGQLLVALENQDLAGAATESRAAYELAQATYETTANATIPQESQKAELDVLAAKDALDAQQAIYNSRQRLFTEGAISQKDVNDAQVNLSQARNLFEIARTRLQHLQGFSREQQLKAAVAQRDAAKGRYDASQAQLGYSRIISPIDGVVTDQPLYAGETVPAGSPIITVMDLSQVIARAHISPPEAAELKVGADATLRTASGALLPGKVTQISPALDAASTTVEVWVQADNREGTLTPGSSLRVEMIARTVANTLVIPQAAVLTSPSGSTFAIVIDTDNKPHLRKITAGIRDQGRVQVTDGLESGQRVATTGAFALFKLDPAVFGKTRIQIAPAREEEEPEES